MPDNVHDAENGNQRESVLLDVFDFFFFGVVVLLATLVLLNVFVRDADGSKGTFGIRSNDSVHLLVVGIIHWLSVAVFIQVVGAACLHNFGGALDDESPVVAATSFNSVFNDGAHSLSLGGEWESDEAWAGDVVLLSESFDVCLASLDEHFHAAICSAGLFRGVASDSDSEVITKDLVEVVCEIYV